VEEWRERWGKMRVGEMDRWMDGSKEVWIDGWMD